MRNMQILAEEDLEREKVPPVDFSDSWALEDTAKQKKKDDT